MKKTLTYLGEHGKTIGFLLAFFSVVFLDTTLGKRLPFWFTPTFLGVILGMGLGSKKARFTVVMGSMLGRLVSLAVLAVFLPNLLLTLDLFIEIMGDFIGFSIPAGWLIVMIFSVLLYGIFTILAYSAGNICVRIVLDLVLEQEKNM